MTAVVLDMPEEQYRSTPGLSYSGAKLLLPPNCPALYRWRLDNPQEHKPAFDLGHAVHSAVLGIGAESCVIDADGWTTKAARQARDEAYDAGLVPLLRKEAEQVEAMRAAVMGHPVAGALFEPGSGQPEVSLSWTDPTLDVPKRSRVDWMRDPVDGRVIAVDLKTKKGSVDRREIGKAVASFLYDMQNVFYADGIQACVPDVEDVAFLFAFVSTDAPHLVRVVELDAEALHRGRQLVDRATAIYAQCKATDTWPDDSADIELISLPKWATYTEDYAA